MKINWSLRLKNRVTLVAILMGVISLVYQILTVLGVMPTVSQSDAINIAVMVVDILVLLGVVVDPTTDGVNDSNRAMGYEEPYRDA